MSDIEEHQIFVKYVKAYIDDCLNFGVAPESIVESFEKFVNEQVITRK